MHKLTVFINSNTQPQIQDFAGTLEQCEQHLMLLRMQYTDLDFYLTDPAGQRVRQHMRSYSPGGTTNSLRWTAGWTEHR